MVIGIVVSIFLRVSNCGSHRGTVIARRFRDQANGQKRFKGEQKPSEYAEV
jgi:hypothetical protein